MQGWLYAREGAGGVGAFTFVKVVREEDGNALLDGATDFGSSQDDGGFGPLVEFVFEGDPGVFKFLIGEKAGLLCGEEQKREERHIASMVT